MGRTKLAVMFRNSEQEGENMRKIEPAKAVAEPLFQMAGKEKYRIRRRREEQEKRISSEFRNKWKGLKIFSIGENKRKLPVYFK